LPETGRLTVHGKEAQSGQDVRFELQIGDFDSGRLRQARQAISGYQVGGQRPAAARVMSRAAATLTGPAAAC
jgi:hypothetical protein